MKKFFDRYEAGKMLAEQLKTYAKRPDVIILALPRGGVPVAYQIAQTLAVPLDVLVVRKLGVPGQEELAMGAIASPKAVIFNHDIIRLLNIPLASVEHVMQIELKELHRRELNYRGNRDFLVLANKTIILVDDGIATGATMQVAIQVLRQQQVASIVVAVPVGAYASCERIAELADKTICLLQPNHFDAVGLWYENFEQTSDEEVALLLRAAGKLI